MIVGHNRVISCSLIRNAVIFAPPFLWFWKSVDFDEKSLCECKKCHRGRYIWRRNGKRTLLFAYQRHARLSVFNCFALTPRLQHEKHWFCWIFSMFTYLVLPFGSAPFLLKKHWLCVRLMRCGMVFSCHCVPFRTPTYIAVWVTVWVETHFQKYGWTFWPEKCKKKLRNQAISELFMVDSTGLEPVTPCTSRAIRSYFSVF